MSLIPDDLILFEASSLIQGQPAHQEAPPHRDLVEGTEQLVDVAPEWRALCRGRFSAPFYGPDWIAAYMRAFEPHTPLLLITARLQGQLVGVLPLVREVGLLDGLPARKLRAPANVHTCRFDLVHDEAYTSDVVAVIWQQLSRLSGWDVLELTNVPVGAALHRLMRAARQTGCAAHMRRSISSPFIDLRPSPNGATLLDRINGKFRADLRRRLRKLDARGPVELVRAHGGDQTLEQFYALEAAGWKGANGTAIACEPDTRMFYDQIARDHQADGTLTLYTLRCAGMPVAMQYGLTHDGHYRLLKTAYDEQFHDCSPGQLITFAVLRDLIARGCVEFDFLGPLMEWKRAWKPRLRPHADWYVLRGATGMMLRTLCFRLRPSVGRARRRLTMTW